MSALPAALAQLLRDCLPPGRVVGLVRRVLDDRGEVAALSVSGRGDVVAAAVQALADVPLADVLAALRVAAPDALARIDAVAEGLLPVEGRLGRVLPRCPSLLCFVGRAELVDRLLGLAPLTSGGHMHLYGAPGSGRTAVAAQVARLLADRVPVVGWVDGRCEEGVPQGLSALASDLGLTRATAEVTWTRLSEWLGRNADWAIIVDDFSGAGAAGVVVNAVADRRGRVLTVGLEPSPSADLNVALPDLSDGALKSVSDRWSRRRAPAAELIQGVGATDGVAGISVVAAAWATGALQSSTVADAVAALSPEAAGLLAVLGTLAPAPVPVEIYTGPLGRSPPADLPLSIEVMVRSPRAARESARSLVRRAWAHWVGDRLVVSSLGARQPRPSWAPAVSAALVLDALMRDAVDLPELLPHATRLSDEPSVPPPLRRALSHHVGRGLLREGEAETAVSWLQKAVAAAEGDPELPVGTMASLFNDLGVAWRRRGRLDDARTVLEESLQLDLDAPVVDELAVASTRANLGHVLRELGELDDAQQQYMSSLQLRRENLGAFHPDCAAVAVQLGVVAKARGRVDDARLAWSEALASLGRRPSARRDVLASLLRHLARLDAEQGAVDRAIEKAERAHTLLVAEHRDPEHPEVAALRAELVGYDLALEALHKDRRLQ